MSRMKYDKQSAVAAYWAQVDVGDPSACWEWQGRRDPGGYGSLPESIRRHLVPDGFKPSGGAHRMSWHIAFGVIPPGYVVRHACDNPPCVNPKHLSIGTPMDNKRDAVARGRNPWSFIDCRGNVQRLPFCF